MSASRGVAEQTVDAHAAAAAGSLSSPFKIFRSSEGGSDTGDSQADSSVSLSHTPPYAGVDVEEVEMPLTEDDVDVSAVKSTAATTVILQSSQPDTEVDVDVNKLQPNSRNAVNIKTVEEPLVLMAGTSATMDTLFGEVSDSDSGRSCSGPATDSAAACKNNADLSVNTDKTVAAIKLPSVDVEDGEITDSDTEPATVSPSNVPSVADKENTVVRSARLTDNRSIDRKQQNTRVKQTDQPECEKISKSTSRTSPRRRISPDRERNPGSGNKSRLGCGVRYDERKRSPQFARSCQSGDRKDRRAVRESVAVRRDDTEAKCRSSGRTVKAHGSDHRQLSPRKSARQSRAIHTNSAKFSFGSHSNVSARFVRSARRY